MRSVGGPRVKSGRFARGFGGVPASSADVRWIMTKLQARWERECVPRGRNTSSPRRWRQMWGREGEAASWMCTQEWILSSDATANLALDVDRDDQYLRN